jgi:hypothetical protein
MIQVFPNAIDQISLSAHATLVHDFTVFTENKNAELPFNDVKSLLSFLVPVWNETLSHMLHYNHVVMFRFGTLVKAKTNHPSRRDAHVLQLTYKVLGHRHWFASAEIGRCFSAVVQNDHLFVLEMDQR